MSQATQSVTTPPDMAADCRALAERARAASRRLAVARGEVKNRWLKQAAAALADRAG
jgi:gamma-glutamyl phosphate reductase